MPSPSLMPKGEFGSGFPERDSPTRPANVNGVSVILLILYWRQKQGCKRDTVPVLMVEKARQTLNN